MLNGLYRHGPFSLNATATRYGEFTVKGSTAALDQTYGAKWVGDLSASYRAGGWEFTLGSDNITDTYPDEVIFANSSGGQLPYSTSAPFGYNGSFYYVKVGYSWK